MATFVEPQASASIVVATARGEVLIARRALSAPFLGGFVAFPGGRVDPGDDAAAAALFPGDALGRFKAAVLREMVEEVALIPNGRRLARVPQALRAASLVALKKELGLELDGALLEPAGRWVTPDHSPIRFDTQFFWLTVDATEVADAYLPELEWARFEPVAEVVARYLAMELLLPPPTKVALDILAASPTDVSRRLARYAAAVSDRDLFEPLSGVRPLALRTPTLPPARHTNALVVGHERLLIVDPATYEAEERERLLDAVQELASNGARPEAVVLTHHHIDHMGAADWLSAKLNIPTRAHPVTRELLRGKVRVDEAIDDGDRMELGVDARGVPFVVQVMHTPGHAPGHIVLWDRRGPGAPMIVGDMVATIGSIIIDPPEGDMAVYLQQLERLRALENGALFPAHGPPIADRHAKFEEYIRHRLMREAKVVKALKASRGTAVDLLPIAYDDTPPKIWPLAARSCLAHLEKLVGDGRATRRGDVFTLA